MQIRWNTKKFLLKSDKKWTLRFYFVYFDHLLHKSSSNSANSHSAVFFRSRRTALCEDPGPLYYNSPIILSKDWILANFIDTKSNSIKCAQPFNLIQGCVHSGSITVILWCNIKFNFLTFGHVEVINATSCVICFCFCPLCLIEGKNFKFSGHFDS